MIELARHIEILLLENDCVIVPDLGGFIAHYQPARYVREENLYLPPVRTIGFNPQLTLNDGLLVQSYMQAHHTDFPDATRMIAEEVADLKENLYTTGCAEMHGIGVLHYNVQGNYEFHPNEDGVLSPSLYGLGSFSINRLEYLTAATSATVREMRPRDNQKKRLFSINRQWVGNAVAAAAAILLFFFLSVPVENTYVDKGNYASLGTDGLFEAIRSQSLATTLIAYPQQPQKKGIRNNQNTLKPITVKVEKVAPLSAPNSQTASSKPVGKNVAKDTLKSTSPAIQVAKTEPIVATSATVSKEASPAATKVQPVSATKEIQVSVPVPTTDKKMAVTNATGKYCIVVSSLPTVKDAQDMVNRYKRQGFNGACYTEGGGRYRVILQRFTDKSAAYQKLGEVRKNEIFKSAWMLIEK